jgi:type IV fimbrial biogenesis protein FimT
MDQISGPFSSVSPIPRPIRPYTGVLGFTLIELLVVLAIIAILLGVAVPSFQRSIAQNAINGSTNTLAGDMKFARSEALKRGLSVALCPSVSPYSVCAASGQWANGWIVFIDRDNNNARDATVAASEELLRVQQDLEVRNLSMAGAQAVNSIRFDHSGTSAAPLSLAINLTSLSIPVQGSTTRAICLSTAGRARITAPGHDTCN